ncbi:hypothetical protein KO505_08890 [Psychrosphaera sp. F3M07]|uniref:hypothetical protein n=1 Tax=Psychrosphaera sp. F3M07 TaxID=2841560 RepID=UPI001C085477|nr:hypothetical protein [Psychrosphaera sp. F3M07]MBU2918076.1 hypothetical protein [Psychrosphaera sp. F3M07]
MKVDAAEEAVKIVEKLLDVAVSEGDELLQIALQQVLDKLELHKQQLQKETKVKQLSIVVNLLNFLSGLE